MNNCIFLKQKIAKVDKKDNSRGGPGHAALKRKYLRAGRYFLKIYNIGFADGDRNCCGFFVADKTVIAQERANS